MASIQQDSLSGNFRVFFTLNGERTQKSLKTKDPKAAEGMRARIEDKLSLLDRGAIAIPPGADWWEWLRSDGRRTEKPKTERGLTLSGLFAWDREMRPPGSKDDSSLKTESIHERHFLRLLGEKTELNSVTGPTLQTSYVNQRLREPGKRPGTTVSPDTVQKEIATLQMVWNRAFRSKAGVNAECPTGELSYPKTRQKPPFQTREQIEQRIARGGLTEVEVDELWECMFLDLDQVKEILDLTSKLTTRRTYFFPLLFFIAHTGARISEARRSLVDDFDFDGGQVRIREKKKKRSEETFRWVPMSSPLTEVMRSWFASGHPGGPHSFCRFAGRGLPEKSVQNTFTDWFRPNAGRWEVLHGFHIFRHSIASNLARAGEDQRLIDAYLGHETEEMRLRYRHLFPDQKSNAIKRLFG